MALRYSERRVLLPGEEDDNTAAVAAHQRLCRTAIAAPDYRFNQTARCRLAPIAPVHVADAIAIQDAFHRADVILLDPEIPATVHPACGEANAIRSAAE